MSSVANPGPVDGRQRQVVDSEGISKDLKESPGEALSTDAVRLYRALSQRVRLPWSVLCRQEGVEI
jgi:hypothetical protein